jgi:hypothetical protein
VLYTMSNIMICSCTGPTANHSGHAIESMKFLYLFRTRIVGSNSTQGMDVCQHFFNVDVVLCR